MLQVEHFILRKEGGKNEEMFSKWHNLRRCLAIASLIIGSTAVPIPDVTISKILIALSTGLNAAAIFIKEDVPVKVDE